MILVLDNYDSFTWNLVNLLRVAGEEVTVLRNDAVTAAAAMALAPRGILISPGPGRPAQSGICGEVLELALGQGVPVLGVCLGHQLIGERWGLRLVEGAAPVHGKTSRVAHDGKGLFAGMAEPFEAMRYHSLVLEGSSPELAVTAWTEDGVIMGIRHRSLPVEGLQFHPESVGTPLGGAMMQAWVAGLEG